MISRRRFVMKAGGVVIATTSGSIEAAEPQVADLARLLVGFPPGGSTDMVARRVAEKLRGSYANNVVVENKPGAGAQIAIATLKNSAPDGATLLVSPGAPFSIYPFTYKKLPYALEDLAPVCMLTTFPFVFAVGPGVPASIKSLKEYLDWAKRYPSQANFGSPAAGSTPHLVGELLAKQSGTALTHVAYRGDAAGLQDLMGGQLSGYSTVLGSVLPHLKSDKVRVLAISGRTRSAFVPGLSTYLEQGYAIEFTEWFGLFAPAKTPSALLQRVTSIAQSFSGDPDFSKALADFGMTSKFATASELSRQIRTDAEQWHPVIKTLGFTADS